MPIESEPDRWYDPAKGPGYPVIIRLARAHVVPAEDWNMECTIAYRDREFEAMGEADFVAPRDLTRFTTDLTSVPQLLTWLVPRSGLHLPAALLHDALIPPYSAMDANQKPLPDWTGPTTVSRQQADRVLRDGMADLGVPLLRRWMVWAAVSIPTAMKGSWWRKAVVVGTLAVIVALGYLATLNITGQITVVPWMGTLPVWRQLLQGLGMAVLVPVLLGLLWPKGTRTAGVIVGVSTATLIHVTVGVASIAAAYQVAEQGRAAWGPPKRALKIGGTIAAAALVALTVWLCLRR